MDGLKKIKLAYKNMLDRCYNPRHCAYHNYGGRGIEFCKEWRVSRKSFIDWSFNNGHDYNLSLDRIDVDGNYLPENCRWTTESVQKRNQRRNHWITHNGETMVITDWAARLGIETDTLCKRINNYKIPPEIALKSVRINTWEHGTRHGYEKYKCKCDECRAAHALHHRKRRARKKLENLAKLEKK